jgi:DNA-binding FadR family transcriptional regulator
LSAPFAKGRLKPGEQLLSERELALEFGVSRTAVREAVKTLSEKSLVEAYSGSLGERENKVRQRRREHDKSCSCDAIDCAFSEAHLAACKSLIISQ